MAQSAHEPVFDYVSIREEVHYWLDRCNEKGKVGSKCLILKYSEKDLKTKKLGKASQGYYSEPHKPHQWVFFLEHGYFPVWPDSVSHLCGDELCLNVVHFWDEHIKINRDERVICHEAIKKWLDENKDFVISNSQYTVRRCKGVSIKCHHEPPCFISVGDAALNYF